MKRKLVKQGLGGFTVSVPAKWVRSNNLAAGSEIDMEEMNNKLLIAVETKPTKREISIECPEIEHVIKVSLWNLYRRGYEKIIIAYKTEQQKSIIQNIVDEHLLGFEVTSDTKQAIIIENVSEPSEEKQDVLLRRLFLIIEEMFADLEEDLRKGTLRSSADMEKKANKILQYEMFCRRNISRRRFLDEKTYYHWDFYGYIMRVGGWIRQIYTDFGGSDVKVSMNTLRIIYLLRENFDSIYRGTFKKELKLIQNSRTETSKVISEQILKAIQTSKGKESVVLTRLDHIGRQMYQAAGAMITILLD